MKFRKEFILLCIHLNKDGKVVGTFPKRNDGQQNIFQKSKSIKKYEYGGEKLFLRPTLIFFVVHLGNTKLFSKY